MRVLLAVTLLVVGDARNPMFKQWDSNPGLDYEPVYGRQRWWKPHQYIDDFDSADINPDAAGIKADDYQYKPPPPPPPPPLIPKKVKGKWVYPKPPPPPPPPPGDLTDSFDKYASKPAADVKKAKLGTHADHYNAKVTRERGTAEEFLPQDPAAKGKEPQSKEAFWKKHVDPERIEHRYRNIGTSHEKRARAATDPFIPMMTRKQQGQGATTEEGGYLPQDNFETERHQIRELMRDDPPRSKVKTPADMVEDEEIEDEVSSLEKTAPQKSTKIERHLKKELKKFSSNIKKLDRARESIGDENDSDEG